MANPRSAWSIARRIASTSLRSLIARSASTRPATGRPLDGPCLASDRLETGHGQGSGLEADPGVTEPAEDLAHPVEQGLADRPDVDLQVGALGFELGGESPVGDHEGPPLGDEQGRGLARESGQVADIRPRGDQQGRNPVAPDRPPELLQPSGRRIRLGHPARLDLGTWTGAEATHDSPGRPPRPSEGPMVLRPDRGPRDEKTATEARCPGRGRTFWEDDQRSWTKAYQLAPSSPPPPPPPQSPPPASAAPPPQSPPPPASAAPPPQSAPAPPSPHSGAAGSAEAAALGS